MGRGQTKKRRCSYNATLTTRISTGNLKGDVLPTHGHTNKLLKTKAKTTEKAVIGKLLPRQVVTRKNVTRQNLAEPSIMTPQ